MWVWLDRVEVFFGPEALRGCGVMRLLEVEEAPRPLPLRALGVSALQSPERDKIKQA